MKWRIPFEIAMTALKYHRGTTYAVLHEICSFQTERGQCFHRSAGDEMNFNDEPDARCVLKSYVSVDDTAIWTFARTMLSPRRYT